MRNLKLINESKHNHGASLDTKEKASELRKRMTTTEKILWNKLRKRQQNGMYFRRQHPYGIYILDFFCCKMDLIIELDGEIHLNKKEYDDERTKYLESTGLKVLRFNNEDIQTRLDRVIKKINEYSVANS